MTKAQELWMETMAIEESREEMEEFWKTEDGQRDLEEWLAKEARAYVEEYMSEEDVRIIDEVNPDLPWVAFIIWDWHTRNDEGDDPIPEFLVEWSDRITNEF